MTANAPVRLTLARLARAWSSGDGDEHDQIIATLIADYPHVVVAT